MSVDTRSTTLGRLQQPHTWHMLPATTFEEFCQALVRLTMAPEGETIMSHLIVTVLLAHPANDRDVGKQDLVRELLDALQQGLAARQQGG